jgi:hypothetical protein
VKDDRVLTVIAVRCATLAGVVLLGAVPVYVYVEPPWRGLVTHVAAAFVLGVTLLQLRRALADRLEAAGDSALDAARARPEPAPSVPHHFLDLVSDVRAALRSRRYFERALWPRLTALTSRPLVRPPSRPGRGPSQVSLRRTLAEIERYP